MKLKVKLNDSPTAHQQLDLWSIPVLEVPVSLPPVPTADPEPEPAAADPGKPEGLTMAQLAKAVRGVKERQIAYYHKLGLMPNTALVGNRRIYQPEDIARLKEIVRLHKKGMKLTQIKQRLDG